MKNFEIKHPTLIVGCVGALFALLLFLVGECYASETPTSSVAFSHYQNGDMSTSRPETFSGSDETLSGFYDFYLDSEFTSYFGFDTITIDLPDSRGFYRCGSDSSYGYCYFTAEHLVSFDWNSENPNDCCMLFGCYVYDSDGSYVGNARVKFNVYLDESNGHFGIRFNNTDTFLPYITSEGTIDYMYATNSNFATQFYRCFGVTESYADANFFTFDQPTVTPTPTPTPTPTSEHSRLGSDSIGSLVYVLVLSIVLVSVVFIRGGKT